MLLKLFSEEEWMIINTSHQVLIKNECAKLELYFLFVFKNFGLIAFSDIHITKYSEDFVKMVKNAGRDYQKNKQIRFS